MKDSTEKTKIFNAEAQRRRGAETQRELKSRRRFVPSKALILKNIEASFKNLCAFASLR